MYPNMHGRERPPKRPRGRKPWGHSETAGAMTLALIALLVALLAYYNIR